MDGAVGERRRQRLVDAAVLLDEREARRARARSRRTWKWSPPPVRSITSSSVASGNALLEQVAQGLRAHASIVASERWSPASTPGGGPFGELDHDLRAAPRRHLPRLQPAHHVDHDELRGRRTPRRSRTASGTCGWNRPAAAGSPRRPRGRRGRAVPSSAGTRGPRARSVRTQRCRPASSRVRTSFVCGLYPFRVIFDPTAQVSRASRVLPLHTR